MKNSNSKRRLPLYGSLLGSVILMSGMFSSCKDELLTGQPSWLGESIYAELQSRGNFNETLKLINAQTVYDQESGQRVNAGYADVLAKTGSKTLFVANDEAWAKFYANNPWGVHSLEEMSDAQRGYLFGANMINSAYLVELLSNIPSASATEEPVEGSCMRRTTSINVFDSIPVVSRENFPVVNPARLEKNTGAQIDWWGNVRGNKSIRLMQDASAPTMVHFLPRFMKSNNITSDDVEFLTAGQITSNTDAFVNGHKIVEKDITCQNGYIHILDGVATPLENMAQIINHQPQFSIYNRLMERFSYPHYDAAASAEYQRQYGGSVNDSVFVKRYFSRQSAGGSFTQTDQNVKVTTQLTFDPGWNLYTLSSGGGNITYQYDAAVMLVPTDQAMMDYLNGDGSDIQDRYANAGPGETAWDNAPDEVVLPLLQNTMLPSLRAAIPSQFASINNSAAEPMGVTKADIDKVIWGSNGIIYQTNKVYVAPEYISVFYPCVVRANDDLRIVYGVVDRDNNVAGGFGFYAYLNNMGVKNINGKQSGYSFFIPTDNALQYYYDPVSYKRVDTKRKSTAIAYKFYINKSNLISAYPYSVDWTNLDAKGRGTIGDLSSITISSPVIIKEKDISGNEYEKYDDNGYGDALNHFDDIFNSSLIVGLLNPNQKFYQAKNGGPVITQWEGDKLVGVAGSFQYERGYFIPVIDEADKTGEGNGHSYIIDEEPLMSTMTSPYAALTNPANARVFGSFANMVKDAGILKQDDGANHVTMDSCLTALNNFHYTIYVPNSESVDRLIASHELPTGKDIDAIDECLKNKNITLDKEDENYLKEQKAVMLSVIQNFVNYHIQDNSVYIDGEAHNGDMFESACIDTITNRFVKLVVNYTPGGNLTVTDDCGNTRTVVTSNNLSNVLTRQYFFNGKSLRGDACTQLYSSSYAVIHEIDAPLVPFANSYYPESDYEKVYQIIEKYLHPDPEPQDARHSRNLKR